MPSEPRDLHLLKYWSKDEQLEIIKQLSRWSPLQCSFCRGELFFKFGILFVKS